MPCTTEEYTVNVDHRWTSKGSLTKQLMITHLFDKVVEHLLEDQWRKYFFWIKLTSDKKEPHGYYSDNIPKVVQKEYLVWTGTVLISNIGGQLGLWVGFSFTGLAAGILNLWYWARGKLSSNGCLETGNRERIV